MSVPNPSTQRAKIERIAYAHNSERCQVKRGVVVICYCWCKLSTSYRRGFCDSLKGFPLNQKIKSIQIMLSRFAHRAVRRELLQQTFLRPVGCAFFSAEVVPGIGKGKTSTGIVSKTSAIHYFSYFVER